MRFDTDFDDRSLYCDHHSNPLAADEKTKRAANTPFAAPDQRLS